MMAKQVVGYIAEDGEGVCVPCRAEEGTERYHFVVYEGETHSGQFDDDPVPVHVPIEFACQRCGVDVSTEINPSDSLSETRGA